MDESLNAYDSWQFANKLQNLYIESLGYSNGTESMKAVIKFMTWVLQHFAVLFGHLTFPRISYPKLIDYPKLVKPIIIFVSQQDPVTNYFLPSLLNGFCSSNVLLLAPHELKSSFCKFNSDLIYFIDHPTQVLEILCKVESEVVVSVLGPFSVLELGLLITIARNFPWIKRLAWGGFPGTSGHRAVLPFKISERLSEPREFSHIQKQYTE
jgi:hypothetical protein